MAFISSIIGGSPWVVLSSDVSLLDELEFDEDDDDDEELESVESAESVLDSESVRSPLYTRYFLL